jgi:hypothetical protein
MRRDQTLQIMETKLVVVGPKGKNARKLSEIRQPLDNHLQVCNCVREEGMKVFLDFCW